jgi:NAD-dependent dihydropyrimidine dehydrogenase PreA subunit
MKNVQDIVNANKCTGCAACYSVCGKGYIGFKEDGGFGFPIPSIDNCDGCGNCLRVCLQSDMYDDEE